MRFGVIEYDGRDEETVKEAIDLVRRAKKVGLDFLSVSMGFSAPNANIPWERPAFMAPVVEQVRRETGLPCAIGWSMGTPEAADGVVRNDQADLVMIGRALLANPHWPYIAAASLGVERAAWATLPPPYAYWLERYDLNTGAASL